MMSTPGTPKISNVKVSEQTQIVGNKPTTHLLYTFNVDDHGPFSLSFDKASFDPMQAKQKLAEFAKSLLSSLP